MGYNRRIALLDEFNQDLESIESWNKVLLHQMMKYSEIEVESPQCKFCIIAIHFQQIYSGDIPNKNE